MVKARLNRWLRSHAGDLQAAGFHVDLGGATVGTWLQKYRDGKMAFGLSLLPFIARDGSRFVLARLERANRRRAGSVLRLGAQRERCAGRDSC